jgi:hypothetical protein
MVRPEILSAMKNSGTRAPDQPIGYRLMIAAGRAITRYAL